MASRKKDYNDYGNPVLGKYSPKYYKIPDISSLGWLRAIAIYKSISHVDIPRRYRGIEYAGKIVKSELSWIYDDNKKVFSVNPARAMMAYRCCVVVNV